MKNWLTLLCAFVFLPSFGIAQELKINVNISTPKLKTADPKVFNTLETAISEFINNTKWTDEDFEDGEQIEGSLQINIKEDLSTNSFIADFYVQSVRPVFNSGYNSTLLNHVDRDVKFNYEELTPIQNNTNGFTDNLSAVLSYYVYIILGFDYDTFSPLGGEKYFQIAQNIVSSVPPSISSGERSWVSLGSSRNRYWLVENVLNPRVRPYRLAYYDYHRKSLDIMENDPDRGRAILMSALGQIDRVNRAYPNSMILQMFSDSKNVEIVEIFKVANRADQQKVYNIMTAIDPSKAPQYSDLKS